MKFDETSLQNEEFSDLARLCVPQLDRNKTVAQLFVTLVRQNKNSSNKQLNSRYFSQSLIFRMIHGRGACVLI